MIKVMVVDDEELVRFGLRTILTSGDTGLEVVAEARDGGEATRLAVTHHPDVVLMDIRMPGVDGLSAAKEIARLAPSTGIIMLTTFDLDQYVYEALRCGACGFLLKDTPPDELVHAVRVVSAGQAMLSPGITRRLIAQFTNRAEVSGEDRKKLGSLTERERGVLRLVAMGMSNADIGARLHMSEATVKSHVSRVLTKLDATNRVQAAILAHNAGLAAPAS